MTTKQYIKDNSTSLSIDQIFFIKSTMTIVTVSLFVDDEHIKYILCISMYIAHRNLKWSNNVGRYTNNNNNIDITLWDISKININISKVHKTKI